VAELTASKADRVMPPPSTEDGKTIVSRHNNVSNNSNLATKAKTQGRQDRYHLHVVTV
jgi:hypothetical protein